jgi:hypothetical protein
MTGAGAGVFFGKADHRITAAGGPGRHRRMIQVKHFRVLGELGVKINCHAHEILSLAPV